MITIHDNNIFTYYIKIPLFNNSFTIIHNTPFYMQSTILHRISGFKSFYYEIFQNKKH